MIQHINLQVYMLVSADPPNLTKPLYTAFNYFYVFIYCKLQPFMGELRLDGDLERISKRGKS